MNGSKRHIIEKQFVEFNVKGNEDVFNFRNELEDVCRDELIPEIEKLFDSIVPDDRLIRIENLEIDTGMISGDSWKKEFIEKVIQEISAELISLPGEKIISDILDSKVVNKEDNDQNVFLFFLEKGFLPWYSEIKNRSDLKTLIDKILNSNDEDFIVRLKSILKKKEKALNRLILQLDESELKKFSKKLFSEIIFSEKEPDRALEIILYVFKSINLNKELQKELMYSKWFEVLLNVRSKEKDSGLIKEISLGILSAPVMKRDPGLRNEFINNLNEQLKRIGEPAIEPEIEEKRIKEINKTEPEIEMTNESEWYINNSGLVLLHPFLVKLFENTGYVENNEWVSKELQQRAIALTQYAVNGEAEIPEFLLLLNKVLCGYELSDSLPADIKLSKFEKNEADELLDSVIGHWTAIKNTTVNGLRETFMLRNGKLTKDDSGWLLQVEVKTVDILLNKLPWGISMIKLPWMKEMLRVEWVY